MKHIPLLLLIGLLPILTGFGPFDVINAVTHTVEAGNKMKHSSDLKTDADVLAYRQKLSTKFANDPDTDAWHDQRQKIALATGDRIFDQDFARVFDSLVQAASSLELKMGNMERTSGYVSASGISLAPSEAKAMRREMATKWCELNGFDPAVFDRPMKTSEMTQAGALVDLDGMMAKYEKAQRGLSFQLVKMGEKQTKVKLRFSDVYYPAEVEAYYKLVWQAVDKQIFIDQNIEGGVEKRTESSPAAQPPSK